MDDESGEPPTRLRCLWEPLRAGQSTFEYAAVLAVVAAALISMAVYLKRGVSGRIRAAADAAGEQYQPGATTSDLTLTFKGTSTTTSTLLRGQAVGGGIVADVMEFKTTVDERTGKTGKETVGPPGARTETD